MKKVMLLIIAIFAIFFLLNEPRDRDVIYGGYSNNTLGYPIDNDRLEDK